MFFQSQWMKIFLNKWLESYDRVNASEFSSPSPDSDSPSSEACHDYATIRECFNLISFILIPKFSNFKIDMVGLRNSVVGLSPTWPTPGYGTIAYWPILLISIKNYKYWSSEWSSFPYMIFSIERYFILNTFQ